MAEKKKQFVSADPDSVATPQAQPAQSEFIGEVKLPSNCQCYPFDKLMARPLKTAEVKNLRALILGDSTMSLASALAPAFSSNPGQLTHGDFWVAAAWLRANTFQSSPLTVQWECNACNHENKTVVDLENIEVLNLDSEYREPGIMTLPVSGDEIKLRLFRVDDETRVTSYLEGMSPDGKVNPSDRWICELAATIYDKQIHPAYEYCKRLDPNDLLFIEQFQSEFAHGFPRTIKGECENDVGGKRCGFVASHIRFSFRPLDTLPDRVDSTNFRSAIRFS